MQKWVPYSQRYLFNAIPDTNHNANPAILQNWVPYSQRYLVLGLVRLVGLVGLVGLALWLVSGIALNKYRCEWVCRKTAPSAPAPNIRLHSSDNFPVPTLQLGHAVMA